MNFGQDYVISYHHKGNAAGDIDLYIDGGLIGSFTDRNIGVDPRRFGGVGNSSTDPGFDNTTMDNFSLGGFIPEPASLSLLALGGLTMLRRRR